MKKVILIFVLLITQVGSLKLLAQANLIGPTNEVLREKKDVNIEGSPYYNEEWIDGVLEDKDGKKIEIPLKYNAINNQIHVKSQGKEMTIDGKLYKGFTLYIEGKSVVFRNGFEFGDYNKSMFFQVLYNGKSKLLKYFSKTLIDKTVANYGTATVKKAYQDDERLFILNADNTYMQVKSNKKEIISFLSTINKEADNYVSKSKLNVKKEEDLIKVLNYLDN